MRIGGSGRLQLQAAPPVAKGGTAPSGALDALPDGSRVSGRLEGTGNNLRFIHEGRSYPAKLEDPQSALPAGRQTVFTVFRENGRLLLQPQTGSLLPQGADVPAHARPVIAQAAGVLRVLGFPVDREMVNRLVANASRLAPGDPPLFTLLLMEGGTGRPGIGRLVERLLATLRRGGSRPSAADLRQLLESFGQVAASIPPVDENPAARHAPVGLLWFPAPDPQGEPVPALIVNGASGRDACRLFSELEFSRLGLVHVMMQAFPGRIPESTLFCEAEHVPELRRAFAEVPGVAVALRQAGGGLLEWPLAFLAETGGMRYETRV